MRTSRPAARVAAFTAVVGLSLALLGSPAAAGGGSLCAGFAEGASISMFDFCFGAATTFVEAGATITVGNEGTEPHDITAIDGSFASGVVEPGASWELSVAEVGVVRYYCTLHGTPDGSGMAGVLVVGGPATAPAALETAAAGGEPSPAFASDGDAGTSLVDAALIAATARPADTDPGNQTTALVALAFGATALGLGLGLGLRRRGDAA